MTVYSDSELMVRQLSGAYKVKSEAIRPLFEQVNDLRSQFDSCLVRHVLREKNADADQIVNQALDARRNVEAEEDHRRRVAVSRPSQPGPKAREVRSRRSKQRALQTSNFKLPQKRLTASLRTCLSMPSQKRIRLGVLISGGGRTMTNILDAIQRGELNAEIAIVISSLSAVAGVGRARSAGLPLKIVRKKDCADLDAFSRQIVEELDAAQVDLVVQGGWLCLWKIPPQYENRVMNIHPALLPCFGGRASGAITCTRRSSPPAARSAAAPSTLHNEYDKGPIIVQRTCPVLEDDTPDTLAARVFEQECIAYPEAIKLFAEGRLQVQGNRVKVKR